MTNVIQLFTVSKESILRRQCAIVVFESMTKAYTPNSVLDNWAFLWFDYVDEFKPERVEETFQLWVAFRMVHPHPRRIKQSSGFKAFLLVMGWMAASALVGAAISSW